MEKTGDQLRSKEQELEYTEEDLYSKEWLEAHKDEAVAIINQALDTGEWSSQAQVLFNRITTRNEAYNQEALADLYGRVRELTIAANLITAILRASGLIHDPDEESDTVTTTTTKGEVLN